MNNENKINTHDNDTMQQAMVRVAALSNLKLHANSLDIPILNGFNINTNNGQEPGLIMAYSNGKGLSQNLTSDGPLTQNETFEDRIDLVINNVINYTKKLSPKNTEKNIFFVKDYEATFKFKVYVQDLLLNGKLIRQLNAYFVEPKFNDFYQLTVAAGPFNFPSENITIGKITENDEITKVLITMLDTLMQNLKYKDGEQVKILSDVEKKIDDYDNEINIDENKIEMIDIKYDYSNIVPKLDNVLSLVEYCDTVYKQLLQKVEEDEKRNERFVREYKNYNYAKDYGAGLSISIRQQDIYKITSCKTYEEVLSMAQSNQMINLDSVIVSLDLSFKRGKGDDLAEHDNKFEIKFEPYNITFSRKANHQEQDMIIVEQNIKQILEQFEVCNTIFCSK